jgi:hypothetical protein
MMKRPQVWDTDIAQSDLAPENDDAPQSVAITA